MARQFLRSITLENGQVTGGIFDFLLEDDLPLPVGLTPGGYTHANIVVDQFGRVRAASDGTTTLTGDVTGSGIASVATTIANDAVTNAKLDNMAEATVKGRAVSAGTGDPVDLTATQLVAIVSTADGSGSGLDADTVDGSHASAFQPVDATLTSLAAYNTNGLITQTAADTFAGRTITGTADKITVTDGNGVAGNPTLTISATYAGQNTIVTVGTITTGVWTGTDIALADGGTGASLADPGADRIMFWDDSAGAVTWLTAGTNLTITDTTINAAGGALSDGDYGDVAVSGSGTVMEVESVAAEFALLGDISPAALAADTHNWNPTGLSTASTIRISSTSQIVLTGLQGGSDGRIIILHNVGSFTIEVAALSGSSLAANQFHGGTTLFAGDAVMIQYDSTSTHWHILSFVPPGDWAGPGNYKVYGTSSVGTLAFYDLVPAYFQSLTACSVAGRSANSAGAGADIALAESELLARVGNAVDGYTLDDFTEDDIALGDKIIFADVGSSSETNSVAFERVFGFADPSICQGRLTLTSGTAVTTADVTAAGTIYFALYDGNRVALYDGTRWKLYVFTERSLALTLTSGKNYDVFLYDNAGTLTLELSAAWTNDTTRADALTTQDGVKVKSGATTRRWLGTIRASGANTTEDSAGGSTTKVGGKRFVWNAQNQVPRGLLVHDKTDSWNYNTASWRISDGASAPSNCVEYVTGDASTLVTAHNAQTVTLGSNTTSAAAVGVGVDSGTVFSGRTQQGFVNDTAFVVIGPLNARYVGHPGLGYHYLSMLEIGIVAGTCTFKGDDGGTMQSGMDAWIMG